VTNPLESSIERIVAALGRYYGAVSRDGFISLLLSRNQNLPLDIFEAPPLTPASIVARALLNLTDGSLTTPRLINSINDLIAGSGRSAGDPSPTSDEVSDLISTIRILYEPRFSDSSGIILTPSSVPTVGASPQGVHRSDDQFSMRAIAGLPETSPVNSNSGSPDPTGRTLSMVQVFANRLSPASRDMGALSLFMNSIPTIEISRAVPFIDVVLIQEGAQLDSTGRINSLSLGQFLLGNDTVDPASPQAVILGANDAAVVAENDREPMFERTAADSEEVRPMPISTAGMELFTSPQTLVPGDEFHYEDDSPEVGGDAAPGATPNSVLRRQAPVIDRFRPLMTLKNLSLSVVPSGGMMSYKSARMTLVLHDRSRLAEVAVFVRPALYGTTHLMIEYGWAHPDAQPQNSETSADPTNLFAAFIGSLRSREKYQIVNSSFSFDDAGQVEIQLTLSMLSSRAARQVHIGLGPDNDDHFRTVTNITRMISAIRDRMDSTTYESISGEGDILGALTNPSSVLSLSADMRRAIRRLMTVTNDRNQTNTTLTELGEQLTALLGTTGGARSRPATSTSGQADTPASGQAGTPASGQAGTPASGQAGAAASPPAASSARTPRRVGAIEELRSSITENIRRKVENLWRTSDPFFTPVTVGTPITNPANYVSFGKVMASFVGSSVAESEHYKDVQIIFYNFNDKASFMANRNIASFPIPKDDFQSTLEGELAQLVNMPIETFISFLSTYFLSDPGAHAYGFQSLYESRRDSEDRSLRQLRSRYRDDDPLLFSDEQRVLRDAYGPDAAGDLEFKMPTLQMHMEAIPENGDDNAQNTVLRIHIFDSQGSTYSTLQTFLDASSSRSIGLINTAAQNASMSLNRVTTDTGTSTASESVSDVAEFNRQIAEAQRIGLLEQWPPTSSGTPTASTPSRTTAPRFRIVGGFSALKSFIMRTMPSVRYGQGSSGIISAKLSSMQDPALTTVNMQRQAESPESPTGARERGLPLQVAPVELTLETFGCPLWNFGQQIFVDFGTGTTADGIYGVIGIDHDLEQGQFKTTVKLTMMSSYARFNSLFNNLENALAAVEGIESGASSGDGAS